MSQPQWYVRLNGSIHGPFDGRRLKLLADAGKLNPEVEVATSRNGPWRQAATIRGLFVNGPLNKAESQSIAAAARQAPPPPPESLPTQSVPALGFRTSLLSFVERWPLGVAFLLAMVALLGFQASSRFLAERRPLATDAAATAGTNQGKEDGEYVVFDAMHVMSNYNLGESDLTHIQVWNFGEIDLVEVDHQQNEQSGAVRDGKAVAKNAETEIRKPVKIPHLTPGVFVGFEKHSDRRDGVWIDFGDIQVCFENSVWLGVRRNAGRDKEVSEVSGVRADGERWEADALNDQNASREGKSIPVRISVADKDGGQKWDTWYCRFRDERKNALANGPSEFLVYNGGIRSDKKEVRELKERRASGRVVK